MIKIIKSIFRNRVLNVGIGMNLGAMVATVLVNTIDMHVFQPWIYFTSWFAFLTGCVLIIIGLYQYFEGFREI